MPENSEHKLPAAIPVPLKGVVVVIEYADAEKMYQFILANYGKPHPAPLISEFSEFATALDHPVNNLV